MPINPFINEELLPDWKERGAPLNTPVTSDSFYWLGRRVFKFGTLRILMAVQSGDHHLEGTEIH